MKNRIIIWSILLIGSLFMYSCSSDENITEELVEARGGNGGQGGGPNGGGPEGGQGGGQDGVNVTDIDSEVIQDWTDLLLELERYAGGMRPNASARALAYIYLASYEVVVPGMRNYVSNDRRLNELEIDQRVAGRRIDFELALNTTLAKVIDHFLLNLPPDLRAKIAEFEATKKDELSAGLNDRLIEDSERWANHVATQVIEYSLTDTEAESQILEPQPLSYEPPTGDGYWTYSADPERALFPYWESVRTFVIAPEETTTIAPLNYSENPNSPYFQQMQKVYDENNEAKEDQGDALHIAEFWSDDVEGLMMSPPARQVSIAKQMVEKFALNLQESVNLYLKLGFALNDAAVSTWKYKYEYMVMRPNVFIHEFIDPSFQTNLYRLVYWPNPSFPGYPSGHSTFASAAGGVFIDFFGNEIDFTDRTHEGRTEFLGEPRTYTTIEDMARENAFSRVPLGVHVDMDCAEGLRLGYEIADAVNDLRLNRNNN